MNIRYLLFSKNVKTREWIRPLLNQYGHTVTSVYDEAVLKYSLQQNDVTVVLLEDSSIDVYELCGELSLSHPYTPIILLLPAEQIDLKKAMYVRATDVIEKPLDQLEFLQAAKKAESILEIRNEKSERAEKSGKIITVCSTKGGVGKTTISINLATALAKQKQKVLVMDLDLQFGDVAIMLDAEPKRTIYEWMKEAYEAGRENIKDYIFPTKFGVDILAAPALPEFAELIGGDHVSYLLEKLKQEYDIIVVDTPPSLVETVIVALEHSDEILIVVSMDLPTLKNAKLAIETLDLLGLRSRIKIVLNRETEMEGMKIEYVEEILGMSLYSRIARDYRTVAVSANQGTPFVISHAKSAVSKGIVELCEKVSNPESEVKGKKRWLSLFARKGKER